VGLLASALLLHGCTAMVVGGAAVGGVMLMDRRTSTTQIDDEAIKVKVGSKITEVLGDRGHVNVTSFNRTVLITGEVPTEADRSAVEQAATQVPGVQSVVNDLVVFGPSSLMGRSNDTYITSKVKTALFDAKDLQVNAFKVVTERSTVYLMGRVTEREAARGAQVASEVGGVRKVVRVFDIVSEEELAVGQKSK
jgi:osmotically-inducible protein OsmY